MDEARSLGPPPPLAELQAQGPLALFFDFDGTLVDIAASPDAIRARPGLGALLEGLAARHGDRLALITGRSLADIHEHIGRPRIAMAGSHGIERQTMAGDVLGFSPTALPPAALAEIEHLAAVTPGLSLEEKSFGAALHFRQAPALASTVAAEAEAIAGTHGLVTKHGKCVVEFVRPGADKAGAVDAYMAKERFAGSLPIFIGDDLTDEDAFAAVERHGGFGIIVGSRSATRARFKLRDPSAVHEWLGL
jgi:trehalose 6-phosphate phosphatase